MCENLIQISVGNQNCYYFLRVHRNNCAVSQSKIVPFASSWVPMKAEKVKMGLSHGSAVVIRIFKNSLKHSISCFVLSNY